MDSLEKPGPSGASSTCCVAVTSTLRSTRCDCDGCHVCRISAGAEGCGSDDIWGALGKYDNELAGLPDDEDDEASAMGG